MLKCWCCTKFCVGWNIGTVLLGQLLQAKALFCEKYAYVCLRAFLIVCFHMVVLLPLFVFQLSDCQELKTTWPLSQNKVSQEPEKVVSSSKLLTNCVNLFVYFVEYISIVFLICKGWNPRLLVPAPRASPGNASKAQHTMLSYTKVKVMAKMHVPNRSNAKGLEFERLFWKIQPATN